MAKRDLVNKLSALSLLTVGLLGNTFVYADENVAFKKHIHSNSEKLGIDTKFIDNSIRPQDGFYKHFNNGWLQNVDIPEDEAGWSSFLEVREKSINQQKNIIESLLQSNQIEASVGQATDTQKLKDFYKSYMDVDNVNQQGLKPLAKYFSMIDKIENTQELFDMFATLNRVGVSLPFALYVSPDVKKSNTNAVYIDQGSLGLPARDYYIEDTESFKSIRKKYQDYIQNVLEQANLLKNLPGAAEQVLSLETKLATAEYSNVENRDPIKTYNKFTLAELTKEFAGADWSGYLEAAKIADGTVDTVIVSQPSYVSTFMKLLSDTDLNVWKIYLKFMLINSYASYLSSNYYDLHFNFYSKELNGVTKDKPREEKAIAAINNYIPDAMGKLYVQKYFSAEMKQKVKELVDNLLAVYAEKLEKLDWMGTKSKEAAREKLDKIAVKIGYPEKWIDYSNLNITPNNLVNNVLNSAMFSYDNDINDLSKPVDKSKWQMSPQTVNAYYSPDANEIVFPAAILQPPFFSDKVDMAVNYGGIGAVIGHEISHGFDDNGSQYDAEGNLNEWMSAIDREKFKQKVQVLIDQYSQYEPLPGVRVNGELTLGENIADNVGLEVAYQAYIESLNGKKAAVIDGFTGDQRFYMGWAQVWREKIRDGKLLENLKSDPHSPSEVRGVATLRNQEGFYQAYGVKQGDGMYLPKVERAKIW